MNNLIIVDTREKGHKSVLKFFDEHNIDYITSKLEYERLQTIPENYTYLTGHKFEDSKRYKAIGNAWTIDVIAHIFNELLKKEGEIE